jgi:hypothetical protein
MTTTTDPVPDVEPDSSPVTQTIKEKTQWVSEVFSILLLLFGMTIGVIYSITLVKSMVGEEHWSTMYSFIVGAITFSTVAGSIDSLGGKIWMIIYFILLFLVFAGYSLLYGLPAGLQWGTHTVAEVAV